MKIKSTILILAIFSLFLPAQKVMACGSSIEKSKTEKTSCSKEDHPTENKSCCGTDEESDHDCSGNCSHSSCHCASIVSVAFIMDHFELFNKSNYLLLNNKWAYVQYIPKAVYLSIWQPPKLV
jgi:hypothetical protein